MTGFGVYLLCVALVAVLALVSFGIGFGMSRNEYIEPWRRWAISVGLWLLLCWFAGMIASMR